MGICFSELLCTDSLLSFISYNYAPEELRTVWSILPTPPHTRTQSQNQPHTHLFCDYVSVWCNHKKNTLFLPQPQIHPAQPLITHTFTAVCLEKNNNNNPIFLPEKSVALSYWWAQSTLTTYPTVLFCSRLHLTLKNISPSCLLYYSVFLKVSVTKCKVTGQTVCQICYWAILPTHHRPVASCAHQCSVELSLKPV